MKLKTRSLVIAILIPVLSTISVCVTHLTMGEFHLSQVGIYLWAIPFKWPT